MNPKASVIIPTYKRPHLIGRAIKGVLKQTYQNFEIVIIDDSPNDETEKVVKTFNDGRIKYIRNEIKKGNPGAKNQGVKKASKDSKYIAFLDDDDEWLPQFLEKTVKKMEERKDFAVVGTYAELRNQNGEFIRKMRDEGHEFWGSSLGNGNLIRKEIFDKENIWHDEKMNMRFEDLDFSIKILKNHKGGCIPEVLRIYYAYPEEKGHSRSFFFNSETIVQELEYFYKKNQKIYREAGNKAEGWIHFTIGKTLCRAGKIKEGRAYLIKALKFYPYPTYLFYYLLALFFPKAFQNLSLIILKHKFFSKRIWL